MTLDALPRCCSPIHSGSSLALAVPGSTPVFAGPGRRITGTSLISSGRVPWTTAMLWG
jgi:hypothetical protein